MSAALIVIMIFSLVGVLIAANAIEQYKQKKEFERHQRITQLAGILREDDELLVNSVQLPMSNVLIATLIKRNIDVVNQIIELMPDSSRMQHRLHELQEHLESVDTGLKGRTELIIPNNDLHSAAMIKSIKKLRHILKRQRAKGNITTKDFADEDNALSFFMLKIFVEYKINQGVAALSEHQLGSARNFFEKAMKTLSAQAEFPEYVDSKSKEVRERIESISAKMRDTDQDYSEADEGEKDALEDLELVFNHTKKKW